MEHEPINYPLDEEFEDGEISDSNDIYTPLQRPNTSSARGMVALSTSAPSTVTKMESESESYNESESDSGSESDFTNQNRPGEKRVSRPKVKPLQGIRIPGSQSSRFGQRFNVWSSSLQEEVMENLKDCGVDKDPQSDRKSEAYDFSLKYRLNGENALKRRQSYSDDSDKGFSCSSSETRHKRFRANSLRIDRRPPFKLRMPEERERNDVNMSTPRVILDVNMSLEISDEDFARDLANKLFEEKDDLMLRVVSILGRDLPLRLFKETQKIESDGGMLIVNGMRRRTPGGVFLFLLKNCDDISKKQKKDIFLEENRKTIKARKMSQTLRRDQKVEELKKTLEAEQRDLPVLNSRGDLLASSANHLRSDAHTNLSNPPPSPVTDCNRENSSDFDTHEIQHVVNVNVTSPEKDVQKSSLAPLHYDDDILSLNCDDMDLF